MNQQRPLSVWKLALVVMVCLLLVHYSSPQIEAPQPTAPAATWQANATRTAKPTATASLTLAPTKLRPIQTGTPVPTLLPLESDLVNAYYHNLPYPLMRYPQEIELSEAGLQRIASYEGFVSIPYNDGNVMSDPLFHNTSGAGRGNCTIGYGHLLHLGPCNGSESMTVISRDAALRLLRRDLQNCERYVDELVTVRLSQEQYDVMVSLTCGWGAHKVEQSQVLAYLNQGLYYEAAVELKTTAIHGIGSYGPMPGLVKRRATESALFGSLP